MVDIPLSCDCGSLRGHVKDVTPTLGNRIVCYCKDCQSFAEFLGRESDILDENGGSDIVQLPQAHLEITEGREHIARLRLSEKGLNRWYAACCKTPIGNTMGAGSPFMGVLRYTLESNENAVTPLRPIDGYVYFAAAKGTVPEHVRKTSFSWVKIIRILWLLLKWKVQGLNKPSPVFDEDGKAVAKATVLKDT